MATTHHSRGTLMSLLVTCWNIQQLSVAKAERFAYNIAEGLKEPAAGIGNVSNVIGFLLENKVDPHAVGALLTRHLGASYSCRPYGVGGSGHTRENIIVVVTNSVKIVGAKVVPPDLRGLKATDQQNEKSARATAANFDAHWLRAPKRPDMTKSVAHPDGWYRGALVLTVEAGGETFRVAALHCPGPDEMSIELWRDAYGPSLAQNADLVVGDFNLRATLESEHWKDISHNFLTAGTTYDADSVDFGSAKWDKVLVRKASKLGISNLECLAPIVPECRAISDHCGLAVFIADAAQPDARFLGANILPSFAGVSAPIRWAFDQLNSFSRFRAIDPGDVDAMDVVDSS
jgi:hypothetical protein